MAYFFQATSLEENWVFRFQKARKSSICPTELSTPRVDKLIPQMPSVSWLSNQPLHRKSPSSNKTMKEK